MLSVGANALCTILVLLKTGTVVLDLHGAFNVDKGKAKEQCIVHINA